MVWITACHCLRSFMHSVAHVRERGADLQKIIPKHLQKKSREMEFHKMNSTRVFIGILISSFPADKTHLTWLSALPSPFLCELHTNSSPAGLTRSGVLGPGVKTITASLIILQRTIFISLPLNVRNLFQCPRKKKKSSSCCTGKWAQVPFYLLHAGESPRISGHLEAERGEEPLPRGRSTHHPLPVELLVLR